MICGILNLNCLSVCLCIHDFISHLQQLLYFRSMKYSWRANFNMPVNRIPTSFALSMHKTATMQWSWRRFFKIVPVWDPVALPQIHPRGGKRGSSVLACCQVLFKSLHWFLRTVVKIYVHNDSDIM